MGQLGDTLHDRRVELGLTIDQVEDAIKVRAQLIRALENGEYARLPNPGYVRGYISSYSRLLELDTAPLLEMYRLESGSRRFTRIDLPHAEEAVARRGQQHAVPMRAAVTVAIVVIVALVAVWLGLRITRGPEPPPPEPTVPVAEPVTSGDAATSPAVAQPAPDKPADLQPFSVTVAVKQGGASWLTVTVDGKKAYEGTLASGQSKTYEAAKSATILVGKPSVVIITRDGKKVTIPESGSTPTVKLRAQPAE